MAADTAGTAMLIGVIGASGDVGLASVQALLSLGMDTLRLGGRDASKGDRCLASLTQQWPKAHLHWMAVDFNNAQTLAVFAEGCDVLLNCAGPSWQLGDRCAQAALEANAHYVDAAGGIPLDPKQWQNHCAVLGAGLQPGITGLLPRWLAAHEFTRVEKLTSYFGLRDQFTLVAAEDFLHGAKDGSSEPLAAWRNGRCSRALTRRRDVTMPCFPGQVQVLPYLNHEGERLAMDLQLDVGQWFNVIADGYVLKTLDLAHSLPPSEAARRLRAASLLDLSGQAPFVTLLVQLDGQRGDQPIVRSVVLGGACNAALTGAMAAASVVSVMEGEIPPGCHHAAQVLPPVVSFDRLQKTSAIHVLNLTHTPIDQLHCVEEGSL